MLTLYKPISGKENSGICKTASSEKIIQAIKRIPQANPQVQSSK